MRIFVTLLLAIVLLGMGSCGKNQSFTVGYLNPAENRYRFVTEGNFMKERLETLGVKTLVMHAADDDALQLEQGYKMLEQGVDALVIAPVNGNTIAPLVREAMNRGVKVIAYNRLINNVDYDLFLTGDNEDNARLFCEAALSRKPSGNYVILGGDRFDRNGFELMQHINVILEPHIKSGKINMLYSTYIEGWSRERAYFELEQVINSFGTDIDAVIACSDPMGMGAYEVLAKYGAPEGIVITGQDATLGAVRSVNQGEMTMTIYHPHQILGNQTAELVYELLSGKRGSEIANSETFNGIASIPTFKIRSIAITSDNMEKELITTGQYTWQQIRDRSITGLEN
jgi:D-xylose transport system substrate-binding protein